MEGWRQRRLGSEEDHLTTKGYYKTDLTLTGFLMEGLEVVVTECSSVANRLIHRRMARLIFSALFIFLTVSGTVASDQEDAAADSVAAAFSQARQGAHVSKLERMGRNAFREKVCKQDLSIGNITAKAGRCQTFAQALQVETL
jgi:hypothetical protein